MATTKVTTDVIDMSGNAGGLTWVKGTTAQEPSGVIGEIREDTDTNRTLVYTDETGTAEWRNLKEAAVVGPPFDVDFLVVAGGGGGGSERGGGGGAGGYINSFNSETSGRGSASKTSLSLITGTDYTVTVGPGGANNTSGSNSIFASIESNGGGKGGSGTGSQTGSTGGAGGGGGALSGTSAGGAGTTDQGYDGGGSGGTTYPNGYYAGAGGGAGSAGTNGAGTTGGGDGGNGLTSLITGTSVTRAGGGGGGAAGSFTPQGGGTGGSGIGGDGASGDGNQNGGAGTVNTGSGGGGGTGGGSGFGGAGGDGVVIIRYPDVYSITVGAGLVTGVLNQAVGTDEKYTIFTAGSGTITFS